MNLRVKKIISLLLCGIFVYSAYTIAQDFFGDEPQEQPEQEPEETIELEPLGEGGNLIFPLPQITGHSVDELNRVSPIDLQTPDNITSQIEYDPVTGNFIIRTQVGGEDISSPFVLNSEEFRQFSMQRSMQEFWRQRNSDVPREDDRRLSLTEMQFDIGERGENIFGPGGIQIRTQGSVDLSFGFRQNRIDNPTLTERARNPPASFNFDENIQLSVRGSVGDRINLMMNYNTQASFDFDQRLIRLAYEGGEDDILQRLEAGSVSMPLNTSLITGATSLFGIRSQLQFGRLTVDAVISQQESESRSVNMRGGAQTVAFEIPVDRFDENRHFFLSQYFYENFDRAMATLPHVHSTVRINRVEVWVTNRRRNFDQARNIAAFADLGEVNPRNTHWSNAGSTERFPYNGRNNLHRTIADLGDGFRNMSTLNSTLAGIPQIEIGQDFEILASARMLQPNEFTVHPTLGYISLRSALSDDEILAVAFEYTVAGNPDPFQVGEFSAEISAPDVLMVKKIKGINFDPSSYTWNLMMRNIYSLDAFQVQSEMFELHILHRHDSTGLHLNSLVDAPPGVSERTLLSVMNLDRLDSFNERRPDGFFDFVEGYTINSATGRIIFPVVQPFGSHLREELLRANNGVWDPDFDNFLFQELYDMTLFDAQEFSERNNFVLRGRFRASSGAEIRLNAMNIPRGSVRVVAGGVTLTENVDFTVDYLSGIVTIINQNVIDSGQSINVSLETQSLFSTQRRTLLGAHFNYRFHNDFNVGATIMRMHERPMTQKVAMGNEPISNTIWGLNMAYRRQSQWLTDMLDMIPLLNVREPSTIAFTGEFAQLIPGHSSVINNFAHIDDFEAAQIRIPLFSSDVRTWRLASAPTSPEIWGHRGGENWGSRLNDVTSGFDRALLAWNVIDPIFTRNNRNAPDLAHIRNDTDQQSIHFVRDVRAREVFPFQEEIFGQSSFISPVNLSFYPSMRGPYNLNYAEMDPATGLLLNPEHRWGGIMRRLEGATTNFEVQNIQYIEFWMMDPFVYNNSITPELRERFFTTGGDLFINLGEISEDVLRDGKKSFESGLAFNPDGSFDMNRVERTTWGYVPRTQAITTGFEVDNIAAQDVGLNGLSSTQERFFEAYSNFLEGLQNRLNSDVLARMENDPFSPLNDPAGDNFHHFRAREHINRQSSILESYMFFNGMEGNSSLTGDGFQTAATGIGDSEDVNGDGTLNQNERFFQYRISIRPEDMVVGQNFIVDRIEATVDLQNGDQNNNTVAWYQFRIPIRDNPQRVGNINSFRSIRFARLFLHGFSEETHMRFVAFNLVRGNWRQYTQDLRYDVTEIPMSEGTLEVSAINIEENSSRIPVNYILPPGVSRVIDPGQTQIRQENEQSMMLTVRELAPRDSRAVFRNVSMDIRQYRRLQMFVHASQLLDDDTNLGDYELTAFIRLGSDHTRNFYEYEIPLRLTPHGMYNANIPGHAELVWPTENMFNFELQKLIDVKNERNRAARNPQSGVFMNTPFFRYDPDRTNNRITVMGNPNIGDIQVIMIGIRNQSSEIKSGEIWVNELRLSEFNEDGGHAALANLNINFSDFGTLSLSGRTETAGFGSIEQGLMERNLEDVHQINLATGFELGRFFPERARVRLPFFYSHSRETINPKFNPLDPDVLLSDALEIVETREERDSLRRMAQHVTESRSMSFSNVRVDIQGQRPRIYDPANFSVSYTFNETTSRSPEIEYERTVTHRGQFNYVFNTNPRPFEPFANSNLFRGNAFRLIRDFNVNYMPSHISYSHVINRHYHEMQLKDLTGGMNRLSPSFRQDFTWSRNFDIRYDFSRSLRFTFGKATNSRIDEPHMIVNRELFPDEFQIWRDSVWSSIRQFGRPMQYQQTFTADYNLPLNRIQFLNWITARGQYNATYSWNRGVNAFIGDEEINMGNIAVSNRSWQVDGRMNLEALYRKFPYLDRVNARFAGNRPQQRPPAQQRQFNETVNLTARDRREVRHRLNTRDIVVTATDANGRRVPVRYNVRDANTITIRSNRDAENVTVNVATRVREETTLNFITDGFVRTLMMVRNVSATYRETNSLTLPGFQPETGFLGQNRFDNLRAPGLDFAFGFFDNDDYIERARHNSWLLINDSISTPILIQQTSDLQVRASLEPIRNLRIEVNALRNTSSFHTLEFYGDHERRSFSGNFSMTHAAIGTSLWRIGSSGNFDSRAYENFLMYREIMAARILDKFTPDERDGLTYNLSSADIMIPAFLAAYTNRNPHRQSLNIFPNVFRMLPNWRITYNGLANLEPFRRHFRSINITHAYRCTYNVSNFSSLLNWTPASNGHYGYTNSVIDDARILSSQYDIGAVTITESFSPLLGIDVTMRNSLTFRVEYRRSRTLNLNMASAQIIESSNSEWIIGAGYRVSNFFAQPNSARNDLTLRADVGLRDMKAIIRRIEQGYSQATSGNKALTMRVTADYVFSERINIGLFYDRMSNRPFITSAHPTVSTDFGVMFRFLLTQ